MVDQATVDRIMARLKNWNANVIGTISGGLYEGEKLAEVMSDADEASVRRTVEQLLDAGWNETDVFLHERNREEVDPYIEEDRALANMKHISAKNPVPSGWVPKSV
jgi:hypothetical protein